MLLKIWNKLNERILVKLKELLAEWLQSTALFEMAYSRQKAWRKVTGLASPLSDHIIKLMVMPNSRDRSHWKKEINEWLFDLSRIILKPENRRLSLQTYWDWLVDEPEIDAVDTVRYLKVQYKNEQYIIPPTLQQDFQQTMRLICNLLAANEPIDLDELIKE